jgi:hypothetical protein
MISFYDSKKFCRMAKDEEDSEIEIRRKLNGGSDRVNMQKICFSKVSGFSKITSAANEYYIVEIAVHQKCQAVLEYISGVVTNAARLNSIALNDHLLITSFGEFSESKVDISRRVQLASSYFNLGAAEFECLFDQSKLRITLPIQVK